MIVWLAVVGAGAGEPAGPRVFVLSPERLAAARSRLGEPRLAAALTALRADADRLLDAGPWSVMDKNLTPPSGDKHDYLSVGPYWWPDPTKPDGLPYIRRDGEVNPERNSDANDSVAMGRMTDAAATLALAWWFTGDARYAERAALVLRTWFLHPATRMNPHLEYGQAIPGITTGRGIGIIDTTGLPGVVDAAGLLAGAEAWTAADAAGLRAWFVAYLDWLQASAHGRDEARQANNHGTWYDVQVAAYARFVGRDDLARGVLAAVPARRIDPQIEPDGRQPHELARTKSFGYSTMNLRGFFVLARLSEPLGIDLWRYRSADGGGLRGALDYLAAYAAPGAVWPHQQLGGVSLLGLVPALRQAARAYDEPAYAALAEQIEPGATRVDLTDPPG